LIVAVLRDLVEDDPATLENVLPTKALRDILDATIKTGGEAMITEKEYLGAFGIHHEATAMGLWRILLDRTKDHDTVAPFFSIVDQIVSSGNLSARIRQRLGAEFSQAVLVTTCRELCHCLTNNRLFMP
jgi:hypothetical protein